MRVIKCKEKNIKIYFVLISKGLGVRCAQIPLIDKRFICQWLGCAYDIATTAVRKRK